MRWVMWVKAFDIISSRIVSLSKRGAANVNRRVRSIARAIDDCAIAAVQLPPAAGCAVLHLSSRKAVFSFGTRLA